MERYLHSKDENDNRKQLQMEIPRQVAGSYPTGVVNPFALATLARHGLDTTRFRSKRWDEFSQDGRLLGSKFASIAELPIPTPFCDLSSTRRFAQKRSPHEEGLSGTGTS